MKDAKHVHHSSLARDSDLSRNDELHRGVCCLSLAELFDLQQIQERASFARPPSRKMLGSFPLPIDSVYHRIASRQGQGKDSGTLVSITNVGQFNCPLCVCLARVYHSCGSVYVSTRQTARLVGCAVYWNDPYLLKPPKPFLWVVWSINLRPLDGIPSSVWTQPHIWCGLHVRKRSFWPHSCWFEAVLSVSDTNGLSTRIAAHKVSDSLNRR